MTPVPELEKVLAKRPVLGGSDHLNLSRYMDYAAALETWAKEAARELEAVRDESEEANASAEDAWEIADEAKDECDELRRKVERYKRALRPFAEAGGQLPESYWSEIGDFPIPEGLGLMVADLVAANDALSDGESPGPTGENEQ